ARETNDVWIPVFGDYWRGFFEEFYDLVMVLEPIQPAGDAAGHATYHRAHQIVLLQRGEILHFEQFHRLQADVLRRFAKIFERNFGVAPFADGMVNTILQFSLERAFDRKNARSDVRGRGDGNSAPGECLDSRAAG